MTELQIPSFDITEGHNVYDDVADFKFYAKLAEDLRDGDYEDGGGVGREGGGRERVICTQGIS